MVKFRGKQLVTIGALAMSLFAFGCGEDDKEDDPQPAATYTLRYLVSNPASNTIWPGVDVDVEPFFEQAKVQTPGDYRIIGDDMPLNKQQTVVLDPNQFRNKKVRVQLSYYFPETSYKLEPGDAITVELLADDKVIGQQTLDFSNFKNQSENTYQANGKIDYSLKTIEITVQ